MYYNNKHKLALPADPLQTIPVLSIDPETNSVSGSANAHDHDNY